MASGELFPEVKKRLFKNIFICYKCRAKIRASPEKVRQGKVKCRKCGYKFLRPKKSERTGVGKR